VDVVRIQERLKTKVIGRELLVYETTSSTNDRIREQGLLGKPEGLTIFAEYQSQGRGSSGRQWISEIGSGLWFSILLRAPSGPKQWRNLVPWTAAATAEALQPWSNQPIQVKPPNDLVIGSAKLAGFLLETSNLWDFQILGIGINIYSSPEIAGYPTTALQDHCATVIDRNVVAAAVLMQIDQRLF
jgi:BirA family transcriptional regulator, biotin operon repressor / biotin---[acetyl-CoA-carboxylase] ligase